MSRGSKGAGRARNRKRNRKVLRRMSTGQIRGKTRLKAVKWVSPGGAAREMRHKLFTLGESAKHGLFLQRRRRTVNTDEPMTRLEGTMMSMSFSTANPTGTCVRGRIRRPKASRRVAWGPEDSHGQEYQPEQDGKDQPIGPQKEQIGTQPLQERSNSRAGEGVKSVKVDQQEDRNQGTKSRRQDTANQKGTKETKESSKRSRSNGNRNMPGGRIRNEEQVGLGLRLRTGSLAGMGGGGVSSGPTFALATPVEGFVANSLGGRGTITGWSGSPLLGIRLASRLARS